MTKNYFLRYRPHCLVGILCLVALTWTEGQDRPTPDSVTIEPQYKIDPKYNVSRCTPKLLKQQSGGDRAPAIQIHKGEKSSGYSPVVSLDILESGKLANVRLTRSSGLAEEDAYALKWIESMRYNKREGCGVIESKVVVTIDWGAGPVD